MDEEWELGSGGDGSSAVDLLQDALKRLADEARSVADPTQLADKCIHLQHARMRLDGIMATTVADADRAGVATDAGLRTMAQFVSSHCKLSPAVTRADFRVGYWVGAFTRLEDAMLDGRISRQHVDVIRKLNNIRVTAALLRDQHLFVEWAQELEWSAFRHACTYWLMVNDQDGPEPEEHDPKNTVTMQVTPEGRLKGTFDLDPVSGGILYQQLGDEENALFHEDQDCDAARTVAQRRAQAFTNLISRGAGRTTQSSKPLIHVVMSLKVLQNAIAQLVKDPEEQDFTSVLDANSIDGRCELIDGTPVHPKYALVLLMQARIRRQVLGAKNVTLDASYETRAFPDWMRYVRLVETRGRCTTAGCDAQHTWLHADHRQPRSKQGETNLLNLDPVCGPDNTFKNDGPTMKQRDA